LYVAADSTGWTGPYVNRVSSKNGGFNTGIGVMNDRMVRTAANGTAGNLVITIPSVRLEDADGLNDLIDGTAEASNADLSNSLGAVQWSVPTSNLLVDLTYRWAITAPC
jgi:hypothetical protein